jgi:hypothetical protein
VSVPFERQFVMIGPDGEKAGLAHPLPATDLETAIAQALKQFEHERFLRTSQVYVDPSAIPRILLVLESGREVYRLTEDKYFAMGEDSVF